MLYIQDRSGETVAIVSDYYNDMHKMYTQSGTGSYDFTVSRLDEGQEFIIEGNYVVMLDDEGKAHQFTIMKVTETETEKNVECEDASLQLLNKQRRAWAKPATAQPISYYANKALQGTGWGIGYNEVPNLNRTLEWTGSDSSLNRLFSIATQFDNAELDFHVELDRTRVIKRVVDIKKKLGSERNDIQLVYGDTVVGIQKTVSILNFRTALYGMGALVENTKEGEPEKHYDFSSVEYDDGDFFSPKGDPMLYARKANERFNLGQEYIDEDYSFDTKDPNELLKHTLTHLKEVSEPEINYEVELADFEGLHLTRGDTVRIIDHGYNPELLITARVIELDKSYTDPSQDKAIFGNFMSLVSGIDPMLLKIQQQIQQMPKARTPYPWVRYADDDKGTGMSMFPAGKAYMATVWSYETAVPSDNPVDYAGKWIKVKGEDGQDGSNGVPGPKGADGQTSYFHTAWADDISGTTGFTTSGGDGKKYIGTYSDLTKADSEDPSKYNWALFKGEDGSQGTPGKPGTDGKTPYLHTAYSWSADGQDRFATVYPEENYIENSQPNNDSGWFFYSAGTNNHKVVDGQYIEITRTGGSFHQINRQYQNDKDGWYSEIKPGDQFAISMDISMTTVPTLESNIYVQLRLNAGDTFNSTKKLWNLKDIIKEANKWYRVSSVTDITDHWETDFTKATQARFIIESASGSDTDVIRIRNIKLETGNMPTPYTTSPLDDPDGAYPQFIGTYTDYIADDSTDPSKYTWAKLRGEQGQKGDTGADGLPGKDGVGIKSTLIQYASNTSGTVAPTTGWTTTIPAASPGYYVWTKYTWTYTDGTTEAGYSVGKIGETGQDGADGIPGKPGANGKTPYFHQAWADSQDGKTNFSTTISLGKKYLGTYTDYVADDSTDPTKYKWTELVGAIEIGGRNYIKNSDQTITINGDTDHYKIFYYNLTPGIWTFSANVEYIRGTDTGVAIKVYNAGHSVAVKEISAPVVNGKITATFDVPESGKELLVYASKEEYYTTPGKTLTLDYRKLEKGNKATDWSQAPEDVQAYADQKAAETLAKAKDEINLVPKITSGTSFPSTRKTGDMHWMTNSAGTVIGYYKFNGSQWAVQKIDAQSLNVSSLSALTANLGTINTGTLNGVKLSAPDIVSEFNGVVVRHVPGYDATTATGDIRLKDGKIELQGQIDGVNQKFYSGMTYEGLDSYMTADDGSTRMHSARLVYGELALRDLVSGSGNTANYLSTSINAESLYLNSTSYINWLSGWSNFAGTPTIFRFGEMVAISGYIQTSGANVDIMQVPDWAKPASTSYGTGTAFDVTGYGVNYESIATSFIIRTNGVVSVNRPSVPNGHVTIVLVYKGARLI